MAEYQDTFMRIEKKYLLDAGQYAALSRALDAHMTRDQFGLHTICNLYFDTPDYALIRRSLDKPIYKEKLRLRSYGMPTSALSALVHNGLDRCHTDIFEALQM